MKSGNPSDALEAFAERLEGCGAVWVVGGSTGLAIRGAELEREPRDLDVYADDDQVNLMHSRLLDRATDSPALSETDRYRSVLSHYDIDGTIVELVGGFRVTANGSVYRTDVSALLYPLGETVRVSGHEIRLVPLGHELLFNLLRERDDRAAVVGSLIRRRPDKHVPALESLMAANLLSPEVAERARRLAGLRERER